MGQNDKCIRGFEAKSHYCIECEKENTCIVGEKITWYLLSEGKFPDRLGAERRSEDLNILLEGGAIVKGYYNYCSAWRFSESLTKIDQDKIKAWSYIPKELIGYKLSGYVSKEIADIVFKRPNQLLYENDLYFIKGHLGGWFIKEAKRLGVLDTWFTPVYEQQPVKDFVISIPENCFCVCDNPKVINTVHPLPDICGNCGKAIMK